MMGHPRSGGGGFTSIELLVVLTVLALLQTLAAPFLSGTVNSMRVGRASESFFSSLQLARAEAIKRNARVVLCKSSTGSSCSNSGGWEQGWIVFHDANNNAAVDGGEAVLLREQSLPAAIRLTGNAQVDSYVSYTPLGQTSLTSGAFQAGTLTVCRQSLTTAQGRQIVVSRGGRVRAQKVMLDSCI